MYLSSKVLLASSEIEVNNSNTDGILSSNGSPRMMEEKAVSHRPVRLVRCHFISSMILCDMKCLTKDTWRDISLPKLLLSSAVHACCNTDTWLQFL